MHPSCAMRYALKRQARLNLAVVRFEPTPLAKEAWLAMEAKNKSQTGYEHLILIEGKVLLLEKRKVDSDGVIHASIKIGGKKVFNLKVLGDGRVVTKAKL